MDGISLLVLPPFGRRKIFLVGTCGACGPHTPGQGNFAPPGRVTYRGLRAPKSRGSDLVGATRPHAPGFTFGRPKVNRKTAKTNGFGFLCLIGLYQNGNFSATESGFCHLIYSGSIDETSPAGLLKRDMFR